MFIIRLLHFDGCILQKTVKSFVEEHFSEHKEYILRDPVLFADYKNTFEESEPRLYEDIQDFDAAKALFQEVGYFHQCQRCIF